MQTRTWCLFSLALLILGGCAAGTTTGGAATKPQSTQPSTAVPVPQQPTPVPTVTFGAVNVQLGWVTLHGRHFAIAFPPDWVAQPPQPITDTTIANATGYNYTYTHPSDGRQIDLLERWEPDLAGAYCHVDNSYPTTLADAPMRYAIVGNNLRTFTFASSQKILFELTAHDAISREFISLDNEIITTLVLDSTTPYPC